MRFCARILVQLRSWTQARVWFLGVPWVVLLGGLAGPTSAHAGLGIHIDIGRFDTAAIRRYDTVYVSELSPERTTFALKVSASEPSLEKLAYDVYYGVRLPDKTILSWLPGVGTRQMDFKLERGLHPLVRNVFLTPEDQPTEIKAAIAAAGHVFTPADPLGDYVIFAIVTRCGTDPSDFRNWAIYVKKTLTVK